jgi:sulfatase modifying factor 1
MKARESARLFLGCAAFALAGCTGRAPVVGPEGRRPIPLQTFWAGLPPATSSAEARGEVALRPPLEGRIAMPGGSFVMGSSPLEIERAMLSCKSEQLGVHCEESAEIQHELRAEAPTHEVTLSPYAIDRTEVTVAAYARCVSAGACRAPTRGTHDPRWNRPDLPVTYVDWEAASTFCAWAHGRLPTEAEWELAARGTEERAYTWGNIYNPYLCNHGAFASDPTDATDGFTGLAPVGSFLDGGTPLGVLDLAGNAAEWVQDRYNPTPEGFGYDSASQLNPKGPPFGVGHVVRGGSYLEGVAWMRGAARRRGVGPSAEVGFRCAADVR